MGELLSCSSAALLAAGVVALHARRARAERVAWCAAAAALLLLAAAALLGRAAPAAATGVGAAGLGGVAAAAMLLAVVRLDRPTVFLLDALVGALALLALALHGAPDGLGTLVGLAAGATGLATVAATLCLTAGRPGAGWRTLLLGLSTLALAELTTLGHAPGTDLLDWVWLPGLAAVAAATRLPGSDAAASAGRGREEHLVVGLASLAAVALLVAGAAGAGLRPVAIAAATLALLAAGARLALALREARVVGDDQRLAEVDELTGLRNRRGLMLGLRVELERALAAGEALSLLLLDLDGFKSINDTLGHHAGDQLLVEVTARLRDTVPDALLGRLGGDEFVVVLRCEPLAALTAATAIREALNVPVALDGVATPTQASVGIATAPGHGTRQSDLLRHADLAMYRAKQSGTGAELYLAEGDATSRRRAALSAELRRAIGDPEQLVVHYQPQLDLGSGGVVAVEALVRWVHPTRGTLPPAAFLELVEQQHLVHRLTLTVLERTLRQRRAWARVGMALRVSVNVTATDLLVPAFPDEVAELLRATDVPGDALVLELTETTAMRDSDRAADVLARLSELGVTLSLDDFGTGSSSLSRLRRLDVHELKVDRSFLAGMLSDRDDEVIVRSVVELGHALGLRVVAEGVETPEQLALLQAMGCDLAQGMLISRPLPTARATLWLMDRAGERGTASTS